ncbi:MAG: YihY family inner membrane protein [Firmicutes bacterium]|nr:YihY family inner membrane protein [Bacillota bacterium]
MFRAALLAFIRRLKHDDLVAYSAQIAFFTALSIIPFLLIVSGWLSASNIVNVSYLTELLETSPIPDETKELLRLALGRTGSPIAMLSLATIMALWSSSMMIRAIMSAIHMVYRERESRPLLRRYILSIVFTLLLAVGVLLLLVLTVFGETIRGFLVTLGFSSRVLSLAFTFVKSILPVGILFLVLWSLYTVIPCRKVSRHCTLPGALISTFMVLIVSVIFSYLIRSAVIRYSLLYGGLSGFAAVLFWFYWYSLGLLAGMEICAVLYEMPEYRAWLRTREEKKQRTRDANRRIREEYKARRKAERARLKSSAAAADEASSAPDNVTPISTAVVGSKPASPPAAVSGSPASMPTSPAAVSTITASAMSQTTASSAGVPSTTLPPAAVSPSSASPEDAAMPGKESVS